jgi:hypothetical protein
MRGFPIHDQGIDPHAVSFTITVTAQNSHNRSRAD